MRSAGERRVDGGSCSALKQSGRRRRRGSVATGSIHPSPPSRHRMRAQAPERLPARSSVATPSAALRSVKALDAARLPPRRTIEERRSAGGGKPVCTRQRNPRCATSSAASQRWKHLRETQADRLLVVRRHEVGELPQVIGHASAASDRPHRRAPGARAQRSLLAEDFDRRRHASERRQA